MTTGDPRNETKPQRDDRNTMELLQELRVAGLGVQVLFGFLLSLPFTKRFVQLDGTERLIYAADLLLAALSTVLLLAPVAYHRLVFRQHLKESVVRTANGMAIAGLVAVALSVTLAVLLVLNFVYHGAPAIIVGVLLAALFAVLWFALPLAKREITHDETRRDQPVDGHNIER